MSVAVQEKEPVCQARADRTLPSLEEMNVLQNIAKFAADSKHFQSLGGVGGIFCVAMYAHEIGVEPLTALYGGMQNIKGKITLAPEMLMALIRKQGHKIEIVESHDMACKIKGVRRDTGEVYTASYTIEEAKKAGLIREGSGWDKNPSDMLFARCSGRLKRRLFPDIGTRAYMHGELDDEEKGPAREAVTLQAETLTPSSEISPQGEIIQPCISIEDAYTLDRDINMLIHPLDPEYKKRALEMLSKKRGVPITSFEQINHEELRIMTRNVAKKIEALKEQELQTSVNQ